MPLNRDDLQALPGVGRKTASVVLNELGIEPAIAVDTHVFRVSHRLGLADAATPDKVEAQLHRIVPEAWLPKAHHWLILHGRYTCTAAAAQLPGLPGRRPVPVARRSDGGSGRPRPASLSRGARAPPERRPRPPSGAEAEVEVGLDQLGLHQQPAARRVADHVDAGVQQRLVDRGQRPFGQRQRALGGRLGPAAGRRPPYWTWMRKSPRAPGAC